MGKMHREIIELRRALVPLRYVLTVAQPIFLGVWAERKIAKIQRRFEELHHRIAEIKDRIKRSSKQKKTNAPPGAAKISGHPVLIETSIVSPGEAYGVSVSIMGRWLKKPLPKHLRDLPLVYPLTKGRKKHFVRAAQLVRWIIKKSRHPRKNWVIAQPEEYTHLVVRNQTVLSISLVIFEVDVYSLLRDLKWVATNHPSQEGKERAKESRDLLVEAINMIMLREGIMHYCVDGKCRYAQEPFFGVRCPECKKSSLTKEMKVLGSLGVNHGLVTTLTPKPFEKKQMVLSKRNGRWYTASIINIDDAKKCCTLRYSDGGVISSIPQHNIRRLPVDYGIKVTLMYLGPRKTVFATIPQDSTSESKMVNIPTKELLTNRIRVEFQGDDMAWAAMGDPTAKCILSQICNEKITYSFGSFNYKLERTPDPLKFVQTNPETGSRRGVRITRNKLPEAKDHFLQNGTRCSISDLPLKYQTFLGTSFPKNTRVYKIEQKGDMDVFLATATVARQKTLGLNTSVKILAHGTSPCAVVGIVNGHGFQKTSTKNGKVYGDGLYLTSDPKYAKLYSVPAVEEDGLGSGLIGKHYVLLCETLIGGKMETTHGTTLLKDKRFRTGGSTHGDTAHICMKPWVYVHTDVLPTYVLEFEM
jgi:hypothetical protein